MSEMTTSTQFSNPAYTESLLALRARLIADDPDVVAGEAERLLDAVTRVGALHVSDGHGPSECGEPDCEEACAECYADWPCPTIRALRG